MNAMIDIAEVSVLTFIIALAVNSTICGVLGIVAGRYKGGSSGGHFWIGFLFGWLGLIYLASMRDEEMSSSMLTYITRLEHRVDELEARLNVVSPDTKGKNYTGWVLSNAKMAPLSATQPKKSAGGAVDEATRRGYRKMCMKCGITHGMKDEVCQKCGGRLAVINDSILQDA